MREKLATRLANKSVKPLFYTVIYSYIINIIEAYKAVNFIGFKKDVSCWDLCHKNAKGSYSKLISRYEDRMISPVGTLAVPGCAQVGSFAADLHYRRIRICLEPRKTEKNLISNVAGYSVKSVHLPITVDTWPNKYWTVTHPARSAPNAAELFRAHISILKWVGFP